MFYNLLVVALLVLSTNAALTKELQFAPPQKDLSTESAILQFIFKSQQTPAQNLYKYLAETSEPILPGVLTSINSGYGQDLLVLKEDKVQLSADALDKVLKSYTQTLAKTLYPKNYFQQYVFSKTVEQKLQQIQPELRPVIDSIELPASKFEEILQQPRHTVQKREVDVISEYAQVVLLLVCETTIEGIYSQVNETLNGYITELESVTVSGDIFDIGAWVTGILVGFGEWLITEVNTLIESLADEICYDLIVIGSNSTTSTRKKRETELVTTRDLFTDVFGLIWPLLASPLNVIATLLANVVFGVIDVKVTLVLSLLKTAVYSVINIIFPTIW